VTSPGSGALTGPGSTGLGGVGSNHPIQNASLALTKTNNSNATETLKIFFIVLHLSLPEQKKCCVGFFDFRPIYSIREKKATY
jgi:hypothetical protein